VFLIGPDNIQDLVQYKLNGFLRWQDIKVELYHLEEEPKNSCLQIITTKSLSPEHYLEKIKEHPFPKAIIEITTSELSPMF
jgi:hypothetical protein